MSRYKRVCANCFFSRRGEPKEEEALYCHHNSPQPLTAEVRSIQVDGRHLWAYWPRVLDDHTCGEFTLRVDS